MRRVLEVSTHGASLAVKGALVEVRLPEREPVTIPVADLECLLLETEATALTGAVLERLAEEGVPVVVCRRHQPVGWLTSLPAHERVTARQEAQVGASQPLRKRLWAMLIEAKVANQASVLAMAGREADAVRLRFLADNVRSGDPDNKEAQAASVYWQSLFGSDFRRDRHGGGVNVLLNYGYTVLRAMTARQVAASGLLPSLGLAHRSARDGLALADDLMEPLRPAIDAAILGMADGDPERAAGLGLGVEERRVLVAALADGRVYLNRESFSPSEGLRCMVSGLVESFEHGKALLPVPRIQRP